jgi:hypothetical protein
MKKELNQLNFHDLLRLDAKFDVDTYDFDAYVRNGEKHPVVG